MGDGFLQTRYSPHPAAEANGGREHSLQGILKGFLLETLNSSSKLSLSALCF